MTTHRQQMLHLKDVLILSMNDKCYNCGESVDHGHDYETRESNLVKLSGAHMHGLIVRILQ